MNGITAYAGAKKRGKRSGATPRFQVKAVRHPLPFSRTRKRIRREVREQRALLALGWAQKTPNLKRENIDRVVFYTDHKIAFNRIAKSGNSSVILYLDEAIHGTNNYSADYKLAKRSAMGTGKTLLEMSASSLDRASLREFSFFTVVRNPWTRTLSAFLDKIANGPHDKYGTIPGFGDNSKTGFEAFIAFLGNGGLHANHHWKPQNDALLLPASHFQTICRLEHLAEELPVALAQTGITLPSPDRLRQPHRIESNQHSKLTQAASKLLQYYSPSTIKAVADLYAADFNLGRYSTDPRSVGLPL